MDGFPFFFYPPPPPDFTCPPHSSYKPSVFPFHRQMVWFTWFCINKCPETEERDSWGMHLRMHLWITWNGPRWIQPPTPKGTQTQAVFQITYFYLDASVRHIYTVVFLIWAWLGFSQITHLQEVTFACLCRLFLYSYSLSVKVKGKQTDGWKMRIYQTETKCAPQSLIETCPP